MNHEDDDEEFKQLPEPNPEITMKSVLDWYLEKSVLTKTQMEGDTARCLVMGFHERGILSHVQLGEFLGTRIYSSYDKFYLPNPRDTGNRDFKSWNSGEFKLNSIANYSMNPDSIEWAYRVKLSVNSFPLGYLSNHAIPSWLLSLILEHKSEIDPALKTKIMGHRNYKGVMNCILEKMQWITSSADTHK